VRRPSQANPTPSYATKLSAPVVYKSSLTLQINNEHERVVLFDLLHRRLCVQRMNQSPVCVHARNMGHRGTGVLWLAVEFQGRRQAESSGSSDPALGLGGSALDGVLFSGLCLCDLGRGRGGCGRGEIGVRISLTAQEEHCNLPLPSVFLAAGEGFGGILSSRWKRSA